MHDECQAFCRSMGSRPRIQAALTSSMHGGMLLHVYKITGASWLAHGCGCWLHHVSVRQCTTSVCPSQNGKRRLSFCPVMGSRPQVQAAMTQQTACIDRSCSHGWNLGASWQAYRCGCWLYRVSVWQCTTSACPSQNGKWLLHPKSSLALLC